MARYGSRYVKSISNSNLLLLAAGVAALGGLAYWAMRTAEASPALPPGPPSPLPPRPPSTYLGEVDAPGFVPQTAQQTEDFFGPGGQGPLPFGPPMPPPNPSPPTSTRPRPLGTSLTFQPGQTYRARIELSSLEALVASPARVRQEFEKLGFTGVTAYASPAELGPDWPAEAAAGATSNTRWARGTWAGGPTSMARPANISAAWEG